MEVVELVNVTDVTEYNIFYQSSFSVTHKVDNFVQFKFENKLDVITSHIILMSEHQMQISIKCI